MIIKNLISKIKNKRKYKKLKINILKTTKNLFMKSLKKTKKLNEMSVKHKPYHLILLMAYEKRL